ncbi:MAG: class I SAM-dependent methyltransferase [Candidatus Nanoarchaeia archaeon]
MKDSLKNKDKNKTKLNLGCGADYKEGWLNVDNSNVELGKEIKKDLNWDLNKLPYPFKDNTFEEILLSYVIEYLDEPIKILKELARISKNNGKIILYVVHANSYASISHLNFKGKYTENTFIGNRLLEYGLSDSLELSSIEFLYKHNWKKYIPFKKYLRLFISGLYDSLKIEFRVKK